MQDLYLNLQSVKVELRADVHLYPLKLEPDVQHQVTLHTWDKIQLYKAEQIHTLNI